MNAIPSDPKLRVTTEEHCHRGIWVVHAYVHVAWAEQAVEQLLNAGLSTDRFVARAEALRAGRRAAVPWEQICADVTRFGF